MVLVIDHIIFCKFYMIFFLFILYLFQIHIMFDTKRMAEDLNILYISHLLQKCPLCSGSIIGRNVALENVAARLFSGKYKSDSSLEESLDLTLRSPSEGVGSSID